MADTSVQKTVKSAHFIGIGGAGMSGIALVLHERGCKVTGSDLKHSHYVRELEAAGIPVSIGHEAATIDAAMPEVVVTSTAIPESNPEVVRARELDIPIWPRAKMLSYLSGAAKTVAVAGTHGKTTTSSMVATMMDRLGMDPSFLIGGVVEGYDTNGRNGDGGYFVCEADESDGSFLYLNPNVVVVTNIEADHLDHYGTLENIEKYIMDIAGIRVICSYISDVYNLFDLLQRQDDLEIVTVKDYIANPKPNGYRSLHVIVRIPVYFLDSKQMVPVEIQLRTVAMDFWASLEHDLKYKAKREIEGIDSYGELKDCSRIIEDVEARMQILARALDSE